MNLKPHLVPEIYDVAQVYERTNLKKFPIFKELIDKMDLNSAEEEENVFNSLQDILENYQSTTLLHFESKIVPINDEGDEMPVYFYNEALNESEEQKKTMDYLCKSVQVAHYLHNTKEPFSKLPNEVKFVDFMANEGNYKKMIKHFYSTPFIIHMDLLY
ncbi:MAG: hypothetical protein CL760_09185 [Chloroflexi bacterium]|nr:hypothetical protein [Chloroflexota bacterium]|tara:strand:- start:24942 stop:25418 length:477 start_codon:yes stop_codon:yes gene_type:complete